MATCFEGDTSMTEIYCNLPTVTTTINRSEMASVSLPTCEAESASNATVASLEGTSSVFSNSSMSNSSQTGDESSTGDGIHLVGHLHTQNTRMLDPATESTLIQNMGIVRGGVEAAPRIFLMEMERDDGTRTFVDEEGSEVYEMDSAVINGEGENGVPATELLGRIFTADSMITEPSSGLERRPNGNWFCDICGHEEELKDDILTHRILHLSDDHSKQCPICEKKFSSLTSLRNHLTVHTGIKKFNCKYCGRKFGWKTQLAIHENLHTGKGLHHCQVCSKSFMTKWLLQRHLKIHLKGPRRNRRYDTSKWTKEETKPEEKDAVASPAQPSKCENEAKTSPYSSASNLVTEVVMESSETHIEEFFKCEECQLSFKTEELLAFHLLKHNTSKMDLKKNPPTLDVEDRSWDGFETWSTSRCGSNDEFVETMDPDRLKLSAALRTTPSKSSLTSIVTKLHHKVDEKQKSDEPAEVLILKTSTDEHMASYLKDPTSDEHTFKDARDFRLADISKQPLSKSSDPFISGMAEIDRKCEPSITVNTTKTAKSPEQKHSSPIVNYLSKLPVMSNNVALSMQQHRQFEKDMRELITEQQKELTSLQSLVSTLNGKIDSLTNIVTSQSLLMNRIFLGGKMVVNGNLDFNVRQNGD